MGEGAFIILVLVVLGGCFLVDKVWDAGASQVNRSLTKPKSHAAGQRLVSREIVRTTPLAPGELSRRLGSHVPAIFGWPSGMKGQLYCTALDETGADYRFANSMAETFTAEVTIRAQGAVSEAAFRILTWKELDGIVQGIEEVARLAAHVEAAMSSSNAAATVRTEPLQPGQDPELRASEPAPRQPAAEPSALALASFPGLGQAHTLGLLPYRVMWEAVSRPDGVRRIALSSAIDQPRDKVDSALQSLQEQGLVDINPAGLIRPRQASA